jgi:hypothetical protein
MTCPICLKPTEKQYRPFCSRRCADVDLGRWLNGSYSSASDEPVSEISPEDLDPRRH